MPTDMRRGTGKNVCKKGHSNGTGFRCQRGDTLIIFMVCAYCMRSLSS